MISKKSPIYNGVFKLVFVLMAILSGVVVIGSSQPTSAASVDDLAIRQVVAGALVAIHSLEVPPAEYHGGQMPASVNQTMLNRVPRVLGQYYVGDALGHDVRVLQDHIRADVPGKVRYLAGGVDNVTFRSLTITGSTAQADVTLMAWAVVAQVQGSALVKAYPRNGVEYSFTLTKGTGRWLIDSEKWVFMPGSEP